MENEYFDTIAVFWFPVFSGVITIIGNSEERHVGALGLPKGTHFAEMHVPYSQCLIAVVTGCFPPQGGREAEEGTFELQIVKGYLTIMDALHVKQVPLPTGDYVVSGRLYKTRVPDNPDMVLLVNRKDRMPVAFLT